MTAVANSPTQNASSPNTAASSSAATGGAQQQQQPTAAPVAAKTTLYVCDLPKDVEDIENQLYRHFGSVGSIVSTKACRDMHSQRLLGHGYVNFQNQADAEKALKTLNFSEIVPGKPLRVSWSQRDPAARKMGTGNVFVKDLDDTVTSKQLFDAFSAIGPISSCKLSVDEEGKTRHYGFVHFENPAHCEKAIQMSESEELLVGGKAVQCSTFKKRVEREKDALSTFVNIYIKNIDKEVTLEQLLEVLKGCEGGTALKNEPFLHFQGGPFETQFALVQMNSHEGATKAIELLHEKDDHALVAKEHKLYVSRAQTKKERTAAKQLATQQQLLQNQGKNLYVKHLDDTMTDEMLSNLFSPYGTLVSCQISRFPETGASKGYGFVVFEGKEAAANAQRELHGKVIGSRPVYVAVAQNRDARVKMLEQQSRNRMTTPGGLGAGGPGGANPNAGGNNMHHHHHGSSHHHHHGGHNAHHHHGHHHHGHHHHHALGGVPTGPSAALAMYGPQGNVGGNNQNMYGWPSAPYGGPQGRGGIRQGANMPPGGLPNPLLANLGGGRGGGMPGGRGGGMPPNMRGGGAANMPLGPTGFPMGPFGAPMPGQMPPMPNQGQPQRGGGQRGGGGNRQPQPQQQGGGSSAATGGVALGELSKMSPEEQKNALGERLFVQVSQYHAPQAAKITGMLLEMDVSEIIHILENEQLLRAKVNEALAVLRDYGVGGQNN